MFKSTNIESTNAKHGRNITNLHQQKECNESEHIIGLIDFDGIDINQQEKMNNAFQNLHHNKYLSYNHHNIMDNEYVQQPKFNSMHVSCLVSFWNWCPWNEQ